MNAISIGYGALNLPLAAAEALHGFSWSDPMTVFFVALLVVLVAPPLCERLRLPSVVGLILAGIALGPYAINIIPKDSLVQPLGEAGLLYLMFLVGLEIDMQRFRRERMASLVFGMWTFCIPQILGTLGARWLLDLSWPAAILMASMFASHTLVSYPIVQRLGLVKERVVTTTAGGTVFTDTLALLTLAIVAESTRSGGLTALFWVRQMLLLAIYAGTILRLAPGMTRWFFRHIGGVESVQGFLFVLVFAYGCAVAAPLAGLEPIIGMFLAGLTLNLLIPEQSRLMIRLRFFGEALFIPFFLISVGLRVNLGLVFESRKAWLVMGFMVAAGYITKFLAAVISGKQLRFSRNEIGVLFGLSVNQAAATLAAVMVGVNLGIFSASVLNGTILMILATCLLGPWVTERYGRRLALQVEEQAMDSSGAPERTMIPVSGEDQIEALMTLAIMTHPAQSGEALYPAVIAPHGNDPERTVANAEKLLAHAVVQAVEAEMPVRSVTRLADSMIDGILGASRDLRISTLILDNRLSSATEFEHVPTRLVEQGRHLVMRYMTPAPLNTCRRMRVAIPPLMERQTGFGAAWEVVRRLTRQAGVTLHVFAEAPTLQSMTKRKWLNAADPNTESVPLRQWREIAAVLPQHQQAHDLTVLFMPRTRRLAWRPAYARLPDLLKKTLDRNPLLVVYPPEMKWENDPAPPEQSPAGQFQSLFPPNQVFLNMPETRLDDALRKLVTACYPDRPAIQRRLLKDLFVMAREAPLRIAPGCLLLHSHQAAPPAAPQVMLATCKSGFAEEAPADPEPPHALVLLLGIPEESPEEHLRRLARIASMFHVDGWLERVCEADSYESLIQRLS